MEADTSPVILEITIAQGLSRDLNSEVPSQTTSGFLTHRNFEINVCHFKPLNLGVICDTVINNYYIQEQTCKVIEYMHTY